MSQSNPKMRPPQAAEYLGFAKSTLAKKRLRGDGPVYSKIGRIVIYEKDDLDSFVAANRRASTSDQSVKLFSAEDLSDADRTPDGV